MDTDNSAFSFAHTYTHARTYTPEGSGRKTKEWEDEDPSEGAEGDELNICVRLFVLLFAGIRRQSYSATLLLHDPCVSSLTTITFLLNNKHVYTAVPLAVILGQFGEESRIAAGKFQDSPNKNNVQYSVKMDEDRDCFVLNHTCPKNVSLVIRFSCLQNIAFLEILLHSEIILNNARKIMKP